MSDDKLRIGILKILYDMHKQTPGLSVSRNKIKEEFYGDISGKELDSNILYLEGKKYVTLNKALGSVFKSAQITSGGIEFIEQVIVEEKEK